MFFDRYEELCFKQAPEGRIFYPYGSLRPGILITADAEQALRSFLRLWFRATGFFIFATIFLQLVFDWRTWLPFDVIGLIILLLWYRRGVKPALLGCAQPAVTRLSRSELFVRQAQIMPRFKLIRLIVMAALMTAASVFLVVHGGVQPGNDGWVGVLGAGFFGLCLLVFLAMAVVRSRNPRS